MLADASAAAAAVAKAVAILPPPSSLPATGGNDSAAWPSTPADRAPPGGKAGSSVSWCTDYLQVMGCEKPHSFKVLSPW